MRGRGILKTVIVLSFVCVLQSSPAFSAAIATKKPGESDAAFVQRITGHDISVSGMVDGQPQLGNSSTLIKGAETLIAFTDVRDPGDTDPEPANDIDMNVFLKQSPLSYARIGTVEVCEVEGGSPTLRTFFYASLEGVSDPVVGVICGWDATHAAADCQANDEVRFFTVNSSGAAVVPMEKFARLFYKQVNPDKHSSFTCTVSKFQTAQDVKKLLQTGR
jgi:hypothetical protein